VRREQEIGKEIGEEIGIRKSLLMLIDTKFGQPSDEIVQRVYAVDLVLLRIGFD